ncbi:unnamed protein product [Gadus morhua 'NCC']
MFTLNQLCFNGHDVFMNLYMPNAITGFQEGLAYGGGLETTGGGTEPEIPPRLLNGDDYKYSTSASEWSCF